MLVIPFEFEGRGISLMICLDEASIQRIQGYDPAVVIVREAMTGTFAGKPIKDISVTFASEADVAHVTALVGKGDVREALRYLTRGWQFRPDKGDYDGPPLSLKPNPKETKQ